MNVYKKIALLSALLCALTHYASGLTPWLEVKPSYFLFTNSVMRSIYHHGGVEIQGSASIPVWNYLDFYTSIGYRRVHGHALNTCENTTLTVLPCDIGLKPIINFCERFYYFFAIGPRFFYFRQHNTSPYVDCKITGGNVGLFANTGFNVELSHNLLLGIFGEYSYEKKAICPQKPNVYSNGSVQMGGIAVGISFGYAF